MQVLYIIIVLSVTTILATLCCYLLKTIPEDILEGLKKDHKEVESYQLQPVKKNLYCISIISCFATLSLIFFYIKPANNQQLFLLAIFAWVNVLLTMIDIRVKLLPDKIIYPFLWLGLLSSTFNIFCTSSQSILGAATLYLLFWVIDKIVCFISEKPSCIGHGDMKMIAALGAWFGLSEAVNLLNIILLTTIVIGAIYFILQKCKLYNDKYFPYGIVLSTSSFIYYILYQI
jgi:prepilin signal peptidase PulO-like enzyme (type II secretory pathway)